MQCADPQQAERDDVQDSRQVSNQVVKVNISSLRTAGYCCCPKELATACEVLIRQHTGAETIVPTENAQTVRKGRVAETVSNDGDHETTHSKSNETSSADDLDKILGTRPAKVRPAKLEGDPEFVEKPGSGKNSKQQRRAAKRKYFTRFMSSEFSKDTEPVTMAMMDSKTQKLFRSKDFNELVSDIAGAV